jgi:hypothetical protein
MTCGVEGRDLDGINRSRNQTIDGCWRTTTRRVHDRPGRDVASEPDAPTYLVCQRVFIFLWRNQQLARIALIDMGRSGLC